MLGIENLKKVVKFALDVTKQISDSLSDGKITTLELFNFIPELSQIPGIVTSWPNITAELKELEAAERQQLLDYVKAEFHLPNEKLESFIENALMNVVSLIALVEEFKALKKPAIPPTV